MTATIKVKVVRKPTLKLKVLPRFPSNVFAVNPILLSTAGGNFTFSFNTSALPPGPIGPVGPTGGVGPTGTAFFAPQGRCTLTTLTSVTTSDVAGATSIFYTPGNGGNQVPIWSGSNMVPTVFSELTLALDNNAAHTGYHQSGKGFDLWVVNDAGTVRFGTGPAWSSDTVRGTGAGTTELQLISGVWTNKNSMLFRFGAASGNTITVPVNQATLVGGFYATADGQASDTLAKRLLFNVYNQTPRNMSVTDPVNTYVYNTANFRQANANAANQLDVFLGLSGIMMEAIVQSVFSCTIADGGPTNGIGINSSTVNSAQLATLPTTNVGSPTSWYKGYPGLGRNTIRWLEKGNGNVGGGAHDNTWFGSNAGALNASGLLGALTI